jgi:predicted TIM-barrel fold metal-dependent hydrolase
MTAIDCHAHVMRRNAPLAAERHSAPKRDVTVAEYFEVLDRHGISHGVLTAPSFYGTDNRLLLGALDASPERLRGTVIVAPDIEAEELEQMGRRGVVGIRLNWVKRASLPDVSSDEYRRLFRVVRELSWHVEVFLEGPKLASVLPRIRESGATVVLDHFGCPDPSRGGCRPRVSGGIEGPAGERHVGQVIGGLSIGRRRSEGLCRCAAGRRRSGAAGLGERLALRFS